MTAEVLVPNAVPLVAVRFLIFCDAEAKRAWWPPTRDAISEPLARDFDVLVNGDLKSIRLPSDLSIAIRVRPVHAGIDQRLAVPPTTLDASDLEEISVDELIQDLVDHGDTSDLTDVIGRVREAADWADFGDWPDADGEVPDDF